METNTANKAHRINPAFIGTGCRLAFRDDRGREQWRQLYAPTADATEWDGAPADSMAIECGLPGHEGVFSYVTVTPVARDISSVFYSKSWHAARGYRVDVTFEAGTDDQHTVSGWIVLD